jgi:hypothetical protein
MLGGKDMTHAGKIESLRGKTLRWTFTDGPTAGTTYEHAFYEDDSVIYRSVEASEKGRPALKKDEVTPRTKCATVKVADDIFAISYLTAAGYTLTVVLNFQQKQMVGFASNNKEWYQQKGTFEVLDEAG